MENSKPSRHFRMVCKTSKCTLWVLPCPFITFLLEALAETWSLPALNIQNSG